MSDSERTNNSFLRRGGKRIEVTKVNNALVVSTTDEESVRGLGELPMVENIKSIQNRVVRITTRSNIY